MTSSAFRRSTSNITTSRPRHMSSIPLSFGKVLHARFSETGWSGDEGGPRNEGSRIRSRPGYGEKFQALLATIELLALGGVCRPIKYVLSGFARRTGLFEPIGHSTRASSGQYDLSMKRRYELSWQRPVVFSTMFCLSYLVLQ